MTSVNLATLEGLKEISAPGERDFLCLVINTYLSDTEARLAAIRETYRKKDVEALARLAHTVIGSSLSVGAEALAALMREPMRDGRTGTLPGPDWLRDCEREFNRAKTALLEFLA